MAGRKRHACQCPPRPVFCPDRPSHSPQAVPQNPTTQCPIGPGLPACRPVRVLCRSALHLVKAGRLTASCFQAIMSIKKGAARRRSAPFYDCRNNRITLLGWRLFLFCSSKTTVTTPRITRQNWNSSAYVTISISPFLPKRGNPPSHAGANRLQPFVAAPCPYSTMAVLPSQEQERKCNSALRQYPFGPRVRGVLGSRPKRPHSRLSRAGAKRG